MKVTDRKCHMLFPTPLISFQYEDFEETNTRIIDEIDAVDWDAYHQEKGISYAAGTTKAEDTYIQIECVLAFIQEYVQGQTHVFGHSSPPDSNHLFGLMHVVAGVRDAVHYLSHLDAVPTGNVTKLEVGDE